MNREARATVLSNQGGASPSGSALAQGLALLLAVGISAACQPDVAPGQFTCIPGDPGNCPMSWYCLAYRNSYRCYPERLERCGDGVIDPGEQCDGQSFDGLTCADFGSVEKAKMTCRGDCTVACAECGNSQVDLIALGAYEQCDDGNLRSHDGCSSGCTVEISSWRGWQHPLSSLSEHSMVFDSLRDRVVLFGGQTAYQLHLSSTWQYDGSRWRRLLLSMEPPQRQGHRMVYDAARHRVILFGGTDGWTLLDDTWAFDGEQWEELTAPERPTPRAWHAMAYDSGREVVVLFGGKESQASGAAARDDTWELGDSGWTEIAPPTPPPGRAKAAMAYDSLRQRTVLFSGENQVYSGPKPGTWEYDGASWTQRATASSPLPRTAAAMVFDEARQQIVLYGGWNGQDVLDTLWAFDGDQWAPLTTDASPQGRFAFAMTYDTARERSLIHGGRGDPGDSGLGDLWSLDDHWQDITPLWDITGRGEPTMVWHGGLQGLLLFGGSAPEPLDETWAFDGTGWQPVVGDATPPARAGHRMTWDEGREQVVLYGGWGASYVPLDDTWEHDGASWQPMDTSAGPTPQASLLATSLAYDPRRGEAVLFVGTGGSDWSSETWSWNGQRWALIDDRGPPLDGNSWLAWEAAGQRLLVFGRVSDGDAERIGVFEQTDGGWLALDTPDADGPDPEKRHVMARYGDQPLFVGLSGVPLTSTADDLWVFRSSAWTQLFVSVAPPSSFSTSLGYDRARRAAVLHNDLTGTWEFTLSSNHPDEQCTGGVDDDSDGLVDCDDPDCFDATVCLTAP